MLSPIIDATASMSGGLPAKAIALLDAAAASSALRGEDEVKLYDVYRVADQMPDNED
jgi:hypothetical protein